MSPGSNAGVSRNQTDWAEQVVEEIKSWRKLQDLVLSAGGRKLAAQVADTMTRRLEHPQTERDHLALGSRNRRG